MPLEENNGKHNLHPIFAQVSLKKIPTPMDTEANLQNVGHVPLIHLGVDTKKVFFYSDDALSRLSRVWGMRARVRQ